MNSDASSGQLYGELNQRSFARDVLVMLYGDNGPTGEDVRSEMEGMYGSEINNAHLYGNINDLVDRGLVEKEQNGQQKELYLTDDGRDLVSQRLEWQEEMLSGLEE